jgi:hypothetical protein
MWVIALEDRIAEGLGARKLTEIKRWLVDVAAAMTEALESDN